MGASQRACCTPSQADGSTPAPGEAAIAKDATVTLATGDPSNLPGWGNWAQGGDGANFWELGDSDPRRQVCSDWGLVRGGGLRAPGAGVGEGRPKGRPCCWGKLINSKAPFGLRRWHCSCSLKHTMTERQSLGKPWPDACYPGLCHWPCNRNKSDPILDLFLLL